MQDLHAVLLEAGVVVWFPGSPVGERHPVSVRPGEKTLHAQVVQAGPDVDIGCGDQEGDRAHLREHYKNRPEPDPSSFCFIPKRAACV